MTQDQTKELQDIYSRLGRILSPVPAPLEVGKWYTSSNDHNASVFRLQNEGNYGFDRNGDWRYRMMCIEPKHWHLSTAAELLPLFIAEAKRRGIVPGARVNRGWEAPLNKGLTVPETRLPEGDYEFDMGANTMRLNGWIVYKHGQWATVLPNTVYLEAGPYTKEQLLQEAGKL